jgi:hypothetical protein
MPLKWIHVQKEHTSHNEKEEMNAIMAKNAK